jgi:hypothetical protein
MSTPSRKRLMRDFKRLQHDPPAGISGAPQDNNIMLWNAVIFGYLSLLLSLSLFRFSFPSFSSSCLFLEFFPPPPIASSLHKPIKVPLSAAKLQSIAQGETADPRKKTGIFDGKGTAVHMCCLVY